MGKKIKNKDIAVRLGVSDTLVSLVLNNKADQYGIKKDTQERVLTLARQMGYFKVPNQSGETFPIVEKPGIIGMIVPSLQDPFVLDIAPYLQKVFSNIGVGFSILTKDPDEQRYNRMLEAFKKFYSGLILVGEAADEYTIRILQDTDYPFVLVEQTVNKLKINTVNTDTLAGSQLLANHIEKLGYKNVLIVTDQRSLNTDMHLIEELKEALRQKPGIDKPLIIELKKPLPGSEPDFTNIEKYLRPPYHTEIIIILHSYLVYPVMAFFQKRKLRVPQDIALVSMEEGIGFDLIHSPVTSLRKPVEEMALKVANIIWAEVKNSGRSKYKRQVNMSPVLLIRNSCGTL
jgi:DNA-binding LacI/PurR family transcriptional regulator